MPEFNTTAWAEIRLPALQHNARVARDLAPSARLMAMIKADGYGHGLIATAQALRGIADGLAVARLEEALRLREAGVDAPLLLLGTLLSNAQMQLCARHSIALVIHNMDQAQRLAAADLPRPVDAWVKFNSGMNRLGLAVDEFPVVHRLLESSSNVGSIVHMTHFSSADNPESPATSRQMEIMADSSRALGDYPVSMANSAGVIAHPDSHGAWIRPGIMLYGDNPLSEHKPVELRQVMQLKTRVIALHELSAGDSVGYNATWTAAKAGRIAVLGIGYGDGYPRHAPNGTPVLVHGERAALAGRVSMDIISVDISGISAPVRLGDEVLLWGEGLPAAEIAERAGTISYELFTGVAPRVSRIYQD